VVEYKGFEK